MTPVPGEDRKYSIGISEVLFVGREEDDPEDYGSFEAAMGGVRPDKIVERTKDTFDTFLDKVNAQVPESVATNYNADMMVSALLNATVAAQPDFAEMVVDNWIPRCYRQGLGPPCVLSFLFMHTLTGEEDDDYTDSAGQQVLF